MSQPEMSYAPAYYQDSNQFIPASMPAAYLAPEQQSFPRHSVDANPPRHPSERSSARPPDPLIAQSHRHSLSQPSRPQSEKRPVVRSPQGSSSTGASNSSGATTAKESRTRGSWTAQSPYMSNDNHLPHGVSRVHKQSFAEDDGPERSPDGLLMLVSC